MSLSVYEKNNVESGVDCVVKGELTFNVLDKQRKQAPNSFVPDPKPEYVVAIKNPRFLKGDENLVQALKETQYGEDNKQLSIRDKSPFPPAIFGSDNEKSTTDKVLNEGDALKNGQTILIHVKTFKGYGNVGCGFDAIKLSTTLDKVELQSTGGIVDADVFDL